MKSSKTTSCVAKKWQRRHFLGVFGPSRGPKLVKISQPFLSMHKFYKNVIFFANGVPHQKCSAGGAMHLLEKLVLKISMRSTTDSMCNAIFRPSFGALPSVQIW